MDCVRFWVPIEQRIIVHHLHACWCHVWWQLRERLVEARGSVLVPGSQPKLGLGLSAFSSSPYETIGQQVKMHAFQKKQICAVCILFNLEHWFSLLDPILTYCPRNSIEFELYVVYSMAPWTKHVWYRYLCLPRCRVDKLSSNTFWPVWGLSYYISRLHVTACPWQFSACRFWTLHINRKHIQMQEDLTPLFEPICALLLQWQEWFGSFFSVVFLFFFFVFLVLSIKWAQSNFEVCADLCKPRFKQPHQALCLFNQFWNLSWQDFEYKSRENLRFNPTWLAVLADLPTY